MPDREHVEQIIAEMQLLLQERASIDDARYLELTGTLAEINGDVKRMKAEIGPGLPDPEERGTRGTLRDRIHIVENRDEAIEQLGATLIGTLGELSPIVRELKQERDAHASAREQSERRWSRRRVVVVTSGTVIGSFAAVIGALGVILRLYGVGGG